MQEQRLHITEEAILKQWFAKAKSLNDGDELVTDGLLFRGDIYYKDGCWHRERGDEEQQWAEATRRLLILTKDLNDEAAWDIRQETGRHNTVAFSYERAGAFYKNLRIWSYGLLNVTAEGYPDFSEVRDQEISGPFYESAPIARINCKKQVGGAKIAQATLLRYLETYADFLKRQIALYDANIILCCGSSNEQNLILDFVRSQYLPDTKIVPNTEGWVYYSPSTGKLLIDTFHPSARIGYEETYCSMMDAVSSAMKQLKINY